MARKPASKLHQPAPPSIPMDQGIVLLENIKEDGSRLLQESASKERITTWYTEAQEDLRRIFGTDHAAIGQFRGQMQISIQRYGPSPAQEQAEAIQTLKERLLALDAIIGGVRNRLNRQHLYTSPSAQPVQVRPSSSADSRTIFVVHGHDEALKQGVARFLEHLELDIRILHEQANEGRTIIEKFEHHAASVGFAVVLATCDDLGKAKNDQELKQRARQNVIFELGFFAGSLGRAKVCVLYDPIMELPSDLAGVLAVPADTQGSWKMQLVKEMRAAGIPINAERVMSAP